VTVSTFSDARLVDGDLPEFTSFISGPDAVAQRVWMRLNTHLSEWFADPTRGMPWVNWQRLKPLPPALVRSRVRETVATVPGITTIRDVTVESDVTTRSMTITIEATIGREVVELGFVQEAPGRRGNVSFYVRYRRLGAPIQSVR